MNCLDVGLSLSSQQEFIPDIFIDLLSSGEQDRAFVAELSPRAQVCKTASDDILHEIVQEFSVNVVRTTLRGNIDTCVYRHSFF